MSEEKASRKKTPAPRRRPGSRKKGTVGKAPERSKTASRKTFATKKQLSFRWNGMSGRVRQFWLGAKVAIGAGMAMALGAGVLFGAWKFALSTSRFAVENVQLAGLERHDEASVLAIAGIDKGQNLLSISLDESTRALAADPWIQSAHLGRQLPGTLTIHVEEFHARALLFVQEKLFLVDESGEPFKLWQKGDPSDLPLISGISAEDFLRDRERQVERLKDATALIATWSQTEEGHRLPAEEVHFSPSGEASMTVGKEGISLFVGAPPYRKKVLRAARVLHQAKKRGGSPESAFVNNRAYPERVVLRVR